MRRPGVAGLTVPDGTLSSQSADILAAIALAAVVPLGWRSTSTAIFWGSAAALVYVYVGYPPCWRLSRTIGVQPIRKREHRAVGVSVHSPRTTKPQ